MNETFSTYDAFEKNFRKTHSAAWPRRRKAAVHGSTKRLVWFLAFVGAAVFGGAHTIPVAVRTMPHEFFPDEVIKRVVGAFTWLFVEFSIFGAGFVGGRDEDATKKITPNKVILVLALMVAIFTTAYSGALEMSLSSANDLWGILVATLMGVAAPIIAWQAGDMFHRMTVDDRAAQRVADDEYRAEYKDYEKLVNGAWTRYLKQQGQDVPEMPQERTTLPQDEPKPDSGAQHTGTLAERLNAHFEAFPDDLDKFLNGEIAGKDMAEYFGVTPAAISQQKKILMGGRA